MQDQQLLFLCFGSGSSGNSYYLGTQREGILIDAGVSARTIHRHLRGLELDFSNILGVFVTHDHADHIRSVGTLGERAHIPIYTTPEIHEGIDRNYGLREKLRTSKRYFNKGETFTFRDMEISTFGIRHDSTDCLGYKIRTCGQCFVLVTDCGEPNPEVERAIREANHLVIEANYDEHRLLNGSYPTYLKERILSPTGHQSNQTCAQLIARNYHPGLRNIFLCHLSLENNIPELAYRAVADVLAEKGVTVGKDLFLTPLYRTWCSPLFKLDDRPVDARIRFLTPEELGDKERPSFQITLNQY